MAFKYPSSESDGENGHLSAVKGNRMKILKRIFGISETHPPEDGACWRMEQDAILLDLNRAPELKSTGGAVRLEGQGLPERVLVVHGPDGQFHALKNRCTHMGRRIDPKPEGDSLECCSVSKSTFHFGGEVISGPAGEPLKAFPVKREGDTLQISL